MTLRAVLYDAKGHDREVDLAADQPRLCDAAMVEMSVGILAVARWRSWI